VDDVLLRYRGRAISVGDVTFMRELIARFPEASRRQLSQHLCTAWEWRQANGAPRDMVGRGLMLTLARAGHLALPPVRRRPPNPLVRRVRPRPVAVDRTPLRTSLPALGALAFHPVRRTVEEPLFNSLLERYHYLGYTQPVGEQLKFLVSAGDRPIACFAWSSAPRHLGPRDRYLGWAPAARRQNVRFIAYNSRYLILPWVEVPHLASHLLGRMVRHLSAAWERVYGHPVYFAETFVDPQRFRGTCYRAANWRVLGRTTGRGHADRTHRVNRSIKDVLGYPLVPDFRARLTRTP
jgi:uncharacterized protein DUF4338